MHFEYQLTQIYALFQDSITWVFFLTNLLMLNWTSVFSGRHVCFFCSQIKSTSQQKPRQQTKKKKKTYVTVAFNPNRAGLLDVAWERGGWISPHLLDHFKTLWKTKIFFWDFLKVHNELGKVTKFGTSRPLFSWRNGRLKKVRADSAPPPP